MKSAVRKRWLWPALSVGALYLAAGVAFGALAGGAGTHRMVVAWRLAAWLVSGCAGDRLVAPPVVSLAGTTVRLETHLWRDFQPISPPDGKPLAVVLRLITIDGAPIPAALHADSAWVVNGGLVWATALTEEPRIPSASYLDVVGRGGPKWGPGIEVEVVAQLRDAGGHSVRLRARRQLIERTD